MSDTTSDNNTAGQEGPSKIPCSVAAVVDTRDVAKRRESGSGSMRVGIQRFQTSKNAIAYGQLRRSAQPVRVTARLGLGLCDASVVLGDVALAKRNEDLDHLSQNRRDAEARSGSVKLQ